VYDHEQPATETEVSAVIALPPRTRVGATMVWRADRGHNLIPVGSQLSVLVEDVLPTLLVQYDEASVGVDGIGKDAQAIDLAALRRVTSSDPLELRNCLPLGELQQLIDVV
jgi:hypothetical protein